MKVFKLTYKIHELDLDAGWSGYVEVVSNEIYYTLDEQYAQSWVIEKNKGNTYRKYYYKVIDLVEYN